MLSQVLNAVLLLPLLVFMYGIARDRDLMGDHTAGRPAAALYLATIAVSPLRRGAVRPQRRAVVGASDVIWRFVRSDSRTVDMARSRLVLRRA